MKYFYKHLLSVSTLISSLAVNLVVYLPVEATIVCKPGTINRYQNGQLERCILANNVRLQVSNSITGIFNFSCQQKHYIYFNEKADFQSCVLSAPIEIKTGNTLEKCLEEYQVYVSVLDDAYPSISCRRWR